MMYVFIKCHPETTKQAKFHTFPLTVAVRPLTDSVCNAIMNTNTPTHAQSDISNLQDISRLRLLSYRQEVAP